MQFQLSDKINKERIHTASPKKHTSLATLPLLTRRQTAALDEEVPALEAGVCLFPSLSCQCLQGIYYSFHVSVATVHKQQTIRLTFNCDFQQNEASLASSSPPPLSLSFFSLYSLSPSLLQSLSTCKENLLLAQFKWNLPSYRWILTFNILALCWQVCIQLSSCNMYRYHPVAFQPSLWNVCALLYLKSSLPLDEEIEFQRWLFTVYKSCSWNLNVFSKLSPCVLPYLTWFL